MIGRSHTQLHRRVAAQPLGIVYVRVTQPSKHGVMEGSSSPAADRIGSANWERRPNMEYFAGLDVSMEETHVCVVTSRAERRPGGSR